VLLYFQANNIKVMVTQTIVDGLYYVVLSKNVTDL